MTACGRYLQGISLSLLVHGALLGLALLVGTRPTQTPEPETVRWDVDMFAAEEPPPASNPLDSPPLEPEMAVEPAAENLSSPATTQAAGTDMGSAPTFGMPSIAIPGSISTGTIAIPSNSPLGSIMGGPWLGNGPGSGPMSVPDIDAGLMPTLRIPPTYPLEARRKKIEGWVRVEMTVLEDGSVAGAKVREARPAGVFDQAALTAVARWKFRPATENGKPVKRRAGQTLRFELQN